MHAVGPKKAALKINHYLAFFLDIEKTWKHVPSYPQLIDHFGAEGLRRVRLPMRWLQEERGLEIDAHAKRLHSEKRRISECLASLPRTSQAGKALQSYWGELDSRIKRGKTSYTSARLALRAAASLMRHSDPAGKRLPTQHDVDGYLMAVPGQVATLTGFTNFLNQQQGTSLKPVVNDAVVSKKRKEKLARSLMKMAKQPEKGANWQWEWLVLGMEYFHERKISKKVIRQQEIETKDDGTWVTLDGMKYWLPGSY